MSGYTPLFGSIVRSSIWDEDNATRIVWITLLALAEADGTVEGSVKGLAHEARVSLKECKTSLEILKAPDPYSKTVANEGRRIKEIDGGWFVLNHNVYRKKAKSRAAYMRRYREEKKKELKEEKTKDPNINTNTNNVTTRNNRNSYVTVTDSPILSEKRTFHKKNESHLIKTHRDTGNKEGIKTNRDVGIKADECSRNKKNRHILEIPPDLQKWQDIAFTVGLTPEEGQNSYDNFSANDWKRGNGVKIESWEQIPGLLRYWRNNRQNFAGKTQKQTESVSDQVKRLKSEGKL